MQNAECKLRISDCHVVAEFCREIETYLCKKNDGHLIRVVGPSFELVSRWAEQGIPIKVAFAGIDRYFERYYRNGPRRRPVKIDFCEPDVLDVFDEWRRATGIVASRPSKAGTDQPAAGSRQSLPEHLERVVTRLSSARASGTISGEFDPIIDRAAVELDASRAKAGGVRGGARTETLARLGELDRAMIALARSRLDKAVIAQLQTEADQDLAPFKASMPADTFARAHEAAVAELVRRHFSLPAIAFE
jgi:hypothetical protein